MVIDESWPVASFGSHVGWLISKNCFDMLDAQVELVSSEDVPMPYNHTLELAVQPSVEKIVERGEARPLHGVAEQAMAEQVLMTALSPTMEEGTIVSWNKSEGDSRFLRAISSAKWRPTRRPWTTSRPRKGRF